MAAKKTKTEEVSPSEDELTKLIAEKDAERRRSTPDTREPGEPVGDGFYRMTKDSSLKVRGNR